MWCRDIDQGHVPPPRMARRYPGGHLVGRRDSLVSPRWLGWTGCHHRRGGSTAQRRWLRPPPSLRTRRGWSMHRRLWHISVSPTFYMPSQHPRGHHECRGGQLVPRGGLRHRSRSISPPIAGASGDLVHIGPDLLTWGGSTLTWMASKGNPYIVLDDAEEKQMWS